MATQFMGVFTAGQTIDRGIRLYKAAFARMLVLFVIPMLLMTIPMAGAAALKTLAGAGVFGIVALMGVLVNIWVNIVFVRYLYTLSTGGTVESFGAILTLAGAKDVAYIIVSIIVWFITMVAFFLLAVIPGIYLLNLCMMLSAPVCFIERRYFFNGVLRVMALGKKRWWKTCAVGSITTLIVMIPIMIAYSIFIALSAASIFGSGAGPDAAATAGASYGAMIGMALYALVSALVLPLWSAVSVVHYNSLRCEKESSDLAGRLDALAARSA